MKLRNGVLLTVLSMHSSLIDAGHHRIEHEHEMEAKMAKSGKSGSSSSVSYESKSGKAVQLVQSMRLEDDDDAMSVVYAGKSSKVDTVMEAKSVKIAESSKSGKYDDDDEDVMSMAEVDDEVSVIYISEGGKAGKSQEMIDMHSHHVGKADKEAAEMSKSGKYDEMSKSGKDDDDDEMSMSVVDDDMSYAAHGKAGKAIDAKAGKAEHFPDAKASKAAYAYYGKSGKASYSMSMVEVDDDMSDDADGEWVPITTDATEAAISTVGATEPAAETTEASVASTAAPESASTTAAAGQTTTFSEAATSTPGPGFRSDLDKVLEDEILLMENGHGGENHVHSKSGETVEISSKIASGDHIRPDALQKSDSATLFVSRYSIAAACIASLYALSL